MRIFGLAAVLLVSFYTLYAFTMSYDINYTILNKIDSVEIRKYPKLIYASYQSPTEGSSAQFRVLANYIFGGNERQEKIGMTSPVNMPISSNKNEMLFLMPKRYSIEDLPKPNSPEIKLLNIEERTVAALRFSGYANPNKVQNKKKQLIQILEKNNIQYHNKFELLVYDSPYKILNRRNEVIVVLK
jgi:effector-binding domain-containing protein